MACIYDEAMLNSIGVEQITLLGEYKAGDTVVLPQNDKQYTVIYNCGLAQGFYINYTLYELKTDEILFFDSDSELTGMAHGEGKNTHFYVFSFKEGPRLLSHDEKRTKNIFLHIAKYFIMRSRGSEKLRYNFELAFGERAILNNQLLVKSAIPFIFDELFRCCDYNCINGANWREAKDANSLQIYIENGPEPIRLTLRIDADDNNGLRNCIGSLDSYLLDGDGNRVSESGGKAPILAIPAFFKGFFIMPLDGKFVDLPSDGNYKPVDTALDSVYRLMFYFHGENSHVVRAGSNIRVGAITLVNIDEQGKRFVRSLSYYTNLREEKGLSEEHWGKLFNKAYYLDAGVHVEFDGMLNVIWERENGVFVCTVMGCEKRAASPLAEDIAVALNYIHEHFSEDLSIDTLAEQAFLSESRFKNKFQKVVGMTPMRYVEHIRIKEAKDALNTGQKDITTLAYELGYSSPSHFASAFRRQTGTTPSAYSKQYRK